MEGAPIRQNRQVDSPGTRTSRSKFPSFPPKFAPPGTPFDPPRGAAHTVGTARERPPPTPVAYAGVARRAESALTSRRVACRSLDVAPHGPEKTRSRKTGASPVRAAVTGRCPNDALTPGGRLPRDAAPTPRPAHAPARRHALVPPRSAPHEHVTSILSKNCLTHPWWTAAGAGKAECPETIPKSAF